MPTFVPELNCACSNPRCPNLHRFIAVSRVAPSYPVHVAGDGTGCAGPFDLNPDTILHRLRHPDTGYLDGSGI